MSFHVADAAGFGPGQFDVVVFFDALHDLGDPPAGVRTVVVVGYGMDWVPKRFASCRTVARLDLGVRIVSEQEGAPVRVCTEPRVPMAELWREAGRIG